MDKYSRSMLIKQTKVPQLFIVVLCLVSLFACSPTRYVTIELPVEPETRLPDSIQSVVIVSRAYDTTQLNLHTDSLQGIFYKGNFNLDTILLDEQAVDTLIKATGDLLFESGRFDVVVPRDRFLSAKRNAFINEPLPTAEVKDLCSLYRVDAVLSLDHFQTKVFTDLNKVSYFDYGIDNFMDAYLAEMKIRYEGLFTIYVPNSKLYASRVFMSDTLFWEGQNKSISSLFKSFTPVKEAMSEAAIAFALDYTERVSPGWLTTRRLYFAKGNSELKHASILVENNNWEAAKALWKEMAENSKSKNHRSRAEFNMAVAMEIQGNTKEATLWAIKSYETMYRPLTYRYLEVLKSRLKKNR